MRNKLTFAFTMLLFITKISITTYSYIIIYPDKTGTKLRAYMHTCLTLVISKTHLRLIRAVILFFVVLSRVKSRGHNRVL